MTLEVEHGIEHQLPGAVVSHLTAAIDPEQRGGRLERIEAEKGLIGTAAQGVAGLMLEQQQRLGSLWMRQQTLLQLLLPAPGPLEGHQPGGLKTDCVGGGWNHTLYLAFSCAPPPRRQGMKLLIHGRNLEVTPAIRDYTEDKIKRAISHFDGLVKEADVHLSVATQSAGAPADR